MQIDTIMLFAAGKGTRMQPLTTETPKPLVKINGRPILHWLLDKVLTYPFKKIIINTHHLAEQIEYSVADYCKKLTQSAILPEIVIAYEEILLETGGGLKQNINHCGEAVFTTNSDTIIFSKNNVFAQMAAAWKPQNMDMMMLLHPTRQAIGYVGKGDFFRDDDGFIYRDEGALLMPYMNTGVHIVKTAIVDAEPKQIFSLRQYYFMPEYRKRIYSIINDGNWCHATSPQDVIDIEKYINHNQL